MKTDRWIKILCLTIGFWASSFSLSAESADLQRIKQNFFRITIPSQEDPFGLNAYLASIPPEQEISDQMVVELHQRYSFNSEKIDAYLTNLRSDGTWPDINYQDSKRSGWEPKVHAERILELTKVFQAEGKYYHAPQVEQAIHRALHYWFTQKPVCPNWWYNQIGIPKTLGVAFILFEPYLTPDEKKAAVEVMKQAKMGMTGQNKVWLAGNVMMRALIQGDDAWVKAARDTIVSEIVTGRQEGIQSDWSFHQHGSQQQFGNYGLAFVSSMSFFSDVFAGTSLAFDSKQLRVISQLIEEGYRWIIWKGQMDLSALGRQLFHHAPIHKALSVSFAATELDGGNDPVAAAAARALVEENYVKGSSVSLVGHKHFWRSDYTIHRRPEWMASVKMASTRVLGAESMNGDNRKGYYMADGATYMYQNGREYLDIFPLWDWRKLPGVTAPQDTAPVPQLQGGYSPGNRAAFVGGVSNGTLGASAMILNRDGVSAHKAWFFAEDFMLCLGAGIHSDSLPLATTIEQCHQQGNLSLWKGNGWQSIQGNVVEAGAELRLFHAGKGYISWGNPARLVADASWHTGDWQEVMQMYKPTEVTGRVVTISLDHGAKPQQATYQYLILPATDSVQVQQFNLSKVQVLRNDTTAQVVSLPDRGTTWIVAYHPVRLQLPSGWPVEIETPGGYLLQQDSKGYQLWCADFSQEYKAAKLQIKGQSLSIEFPADKGKSVSHSFSVKP